MQAIISKKIRFFLRLSFTLQSINNKGARWAKI